MIEKIQVYSDQNIVDLALQEHGSVEGLVALAKRNGLAVDEDPAIGGTIEIESTEIVNAQTKQFFKTNNYIVTTGRNYLAGIFDETFDETFD